MADMPKRKFSLTSAAIAAVGAPIAYASILAKNQVQGALQSINPMNHLQGFTASMAPALGSFSRIYDKLNPRPKLEDQMRGGGGNVDIGPVVKSLEDLRGTISGLLEFKPLINKMVEHHNEIKGFLTHIPPMSLALTSVKDNILKLPDSSRENSKKIDKLADAVVELLKIQRDSKTVSDRTNYNTDAMDDLTLKKGTGYTRKLLTGEAAKKEKPDEEKKGGLGWITGLIGLFKGLPGLFMNGLKMAIPAILGVIGAGIAAIFGGGLLKNLFGGGAGGTPRISPSAGSSNDAARPRQLRATVRGTPNEFGQRPMRSINSAGEAARGGRGILGRITGPMGVRGGQAATRAASGAARVVQGSRGLLGAAGQAAGFVGKRLIPGISAVSGAFGAYEAAKQGRWVEAGIDAASAGVSFIPGIGGITSAAMQIGASGAQDLADRYIAQPRPTAPRTEALATRAMTQSTIQHRPPQAPPVTVIDAKTVNNGGNGNGQGSDADSPPIGFVQRSLPEMAHSVFGYVPSVLV